MHGLRRLSLASVMSYWSGAELVVEQCLLMLLHRCFLFAVAVFPDLMNGAKLKLHFHVVTFSMKLRRCLHFHLTLLK